MSDKTFTIEQLTLAAHRVKNGLLQTNGNSPGGCFDIWLADLVMELALSSSNSDLPESHGNDPFDEPCPIDDLDQLSPAELSVRKTVLSQLDRMFNGSSLIILTREQVTNYFMLMACMGHDKAFEELDNLSLAFRAHPENKDFPARYRGVIEGLRQQ